MLACCLSCLSCSIDGISLGEGRARLGGYGGVLHAMTPVRQIPDASRWQTSPTNTQSVREWEISSAITSYRRSPLTTPKNAKREMCHVIDIVQCVSDETVLGISLGITTGHCLLRTTSMIAKFHIFHIISYRSGSTSIRDPVVASNLLSVYISFLSSGLK